MTLLGNLALWLALLVGIWGALAGFVGGLTDRPHLARSARHAVYAMCAALLVAVVSLEWALFQHDSNVEYLAAYLSRNPPVLYTWPALSRGPDGSLLYWRSVSTPTGSSRFASGRCCRGCFFRSGSASACGGPTSSWGGAGIGRGIRWRTRRSCRGSR